jgi:hypothetical protein
VKDDKTDPQIVDTETDRRRQVDVVEQHQGGEHKEIKKDGDVQRREAVFPSEEQKRERQAEKNLCQQERPDPPGMRPVTKTEMKERDEQALE